MPGDSVPADLPDDSVPAVVPDDSVPADVPLPAAQPDMPAPDVQLNWPITDSQPTPGNPVPSDLPSWVLLRKEKSTSRKPSQPVYSGSWIFSQLPDPGGGTFCPLRTVWSVLRPLLEGGGVLSGMDSALVVGLACRVGCSTRADQRVLSAMDSALVVGLTSRVGCSTRADQRVLL
ncbi:unnamed protein product, partial [Staurois parvus]